MAVPYPIGPMLAIPGEIPSDPGAYALEVKWDGIRALAYVDGGVRVTGRHGADFTSRCPGISAAMAPPAGRRAEWWMLGDLLRLIEPLEIGQSPFSDGLPISLTGFQGRSPGTPDGSGPNWSARWRSPWTRDGRLRNPVWRGLRTDKTPAEVRREELE